jgi:hypothetical protein
MIDWEAVKRKQLPQLILDVTMLSLAVTHLLLVGFDATYLRLRSTYLDYLPAVPAVYDQLKGIEPHRTTVAYLDVAERFWGSCRVGKLDPVLQQDLIQRSRQLIDEDPFARAGLSGQLERIKDQLHKRTGQTSAKGAFEAFWMQGCSNLAERQAFYENQMARHIRVNYWRSIDFQGRPTDYFIWIDLAFIAIFLLEFLIMWASAVRRLGSDQRVLYPLYHWYDLVSCIPLREFRFLRLLRVMAVYYRLIQSDIIPLRNHPLYLRVMKYRKILMEEISDQVSLNILSNIQEKTRLGTSRELIRDTLHTHRNDLQQVVVERLQKLEMPTLQARKQEIAAFIAGTVYESIRESSDYRQLERIPVLSGFLPQLINAAKVETLTTQSIDNFQERLLQWLQTPEGQVLLGAVVQDLIDQVIEIFADPRIQELSESISIQVLEELKKSSHAKTWKGTGKPQAPH